MTERMRVEDEGVLTPLVLQRSQELEVLAAATGGTVVLFGWSGDSVECRMRYDPPPQPLGIPPLDFAALLPGTEAPLYVLLAWLPSDVLDRRIGKLDRVPHAAHDRALLALHLARVHAAGHDVVAGGVRGEVTSIAAPVRDRAGEVTAALALISPSVYLEDLDLRTIAAGLKRIAGAWGAPCPGSPH